MLFAKINSKILIGGYNINVAVSLASRLQLTIILSVSFKLICNMYDDFIVINVSLSQRLNESLIAGTLFRGSETQKMIY